METARTGASWLKEGEQVGTIGVGGVSAVSGDGLCDAGDWLWAALGKPLPPGVSESELAAAALSEVATVDIGVEEGEPPPAATATAEGWELGAFRDAPRKAVFSDDHTQDSSLGAMRSATMVELNAEQRDRLEAVLAPLAHEHGTPQERRLAMELAHQSVLQPSETWQLKPGWRYLLERGGISLVNQSGAPVPVPTPVARAGPSVDRQHKEDWSPRHRLLGFSGAAGHHLAAPLAFGEPSLLFDSQPPLYTTRHFAMAGATGATVWAVCGAAWRAELRRERQAARDVYKRHFAATPLLAFADKEDRDREVYWQKLADVVEEVSFGRSMMILQQGTVGEHMYIVLEGGAQASIIQHAPAVHASSGMVCLDILDDMIISI
jgi:hypothetical protein